MKKMVNIRSLALISFTLALSNAPLSAVHEFLQESLLEINNNSPELASASSKAEKEYGK